jgi:transposase
MNKSNLLAIDVAKDVFQIASFSDRRKVLFNKKVKRSELMTFMIQQPATEVVMEACYSSHYWARCFEQLGHKVKLLPAQHVTAFLRGNKSDANDTIAIGEASDRPNIIPVPVKTVVQQDIQCLHRMRTLCVDQRKALMCQARGLLSEYGVVTTQGHKAFRALIAKVTDPTDQSLSALLKEQFCTILKEHERHTQRINELEKQLAIIAKEQPICQLLMTIPGIGVINATAIYCAIGNGSQFKNARDFAVWLGLTPKQRQSGNTSSSGGITKRGNRYLRTQLVHGARSMLCQCKDKTDRVSLWGNQLVARRGFNKACVAMAARLARLCWILIQKNESYRAM